MATSKPLRADARRNRESLIRAAREIFAEGRAEVPFEDFARRAGVGAGTLYRHFPNRESLVAAVYREEIAALRGRAHQLSESRPPDEALAIFLREMVDHMYAQRGLGRTFAIASEAGQGGLVEEGEVLEEAVAELVRRGVEKKVIRDDISVSALMLALHGIGLSSVHSDRRTEADEVITLLIDGLRRG